MSFIRTDMVEVKLRTGATMTLSEFLTLSGGSLPISAFGLPTTSQSVRTAVSFLESIGGGTVISKPNALYNKLSIHVRADKQSSLQVLFSYENYRQPLNNEARPYTEDSWVIGDTIINNSPDSSNAKIAGWVCVEGGVPGKWETCYRYGTPSDTSNKKVVSYRTRNENFPTYGIDGSEEPSNIPVVLDVSSLTGETALSAMISGNEYDANNLSSNRDDLSDGIIYIKVLEE